MANRCCTASAPLVHRKCSTTLRWCMGGANMLQSGCACGGLLVDKGVHRWYIGGALVVHRWYIGATKVAHRWRIGRS